jgi:hypothetical protein
MFLVQDSILPDPKSDYLNPSEGSRGFFGVGSMNFILVERALFMVDFHRVSVEEQRPFETSAKHHCDCGVPK